MLFISLSQVTRHHNNKRLQTIFDVYHPRRCSIALPPQKKTVKKKIFHFPSIELSKNIQLSLCHIFLHIKFLCRFSEKLALVSKNLNWLLFSHPLYPEKNIVSFAPGDIITLAQPSIRWMSQFRICGRGRSIIGGGGTYSYIRVHRL